MPALTVLTDNEVRRLLHTLNREDILELQQSLADGLHLYSTSTDGDGACSAYQPARIALKRQDGSTTLFMPASGSNGLGVKTVTLMTEDAPKSNTLDMPRLSISSASGSISKQSTTSSVSTTTTFDPPPSMQSAQSTTPKGSLTLFGSDGTPQGFINAEELTAFRTALASMCLFKKRKNVHDLLVFGAGKQAYWHIRLALLIRPEVHHVDIINRDFDRAAALIKSLIHPFGADSKDTVKFEPIPQRPKFSILTPQLNEYERLLKVNVRNASAIFCTTPSIEPLFPHNYLTSTEGRRKGRYIAAIGSYKPHMLELHPEILRQAVKPDDGHRHFHKHAKTGGAVVVDSVESCLREAGEIIQAGLKPEEVVELGELVMLRREAERRQKEAEEATGTSDGVELRGNESLKEWLSEGNVIYKSVGLGLMDVVVGGDVIRLANERGLGTRIDDF